VGTPAHHHDREFIRAIAQVLGHVEFARKATVAGDPDELAVPPHCGGALCSAKVEDAPSAVANGSGGLQLVSAHRPTMESCHDSVGDGRWVPSERHDDVRVVRQIAGVDARGLHCP